MNPLLKRQVAKYLSPELAQSEQLKEFLEVVERSYNTHEEHYSMLQRAMKISSDELFEANEKLRKESRAQQQILRSIQFAIAKLNLKEQDEDGTALKIQNLAAYIKKQSETLKEAVQKQEELLQNLEDKNQALSDYAHMISHDLKSPLRSINSLVNWLQLDYGDGIDDNAKKNFSHILGNLEKMDALIDGILNYSTIEQAQFQQYEVDTRNLVHDIIELLIIPDHITVTVAPELPTILGDKFRLQQLFQNILHNAVKSIDHKEGKVKVAASENEKFWRFEISDNGRGIPEKYHHKIFKIFEKIDNDQAATGIGLSIAKKVVDFYGGTIDLKSSPGKGTTFYFTLPK